MTNYDGVPVREVTQREALAILKTIPRDGQMTAKHSSIPEFFTDSAYYHQGKLVLVQRFNHGTLYIPTNSPSKQTLDEAELRLRIGNTPTCEDCGESLDHCTCDEHEDEGEN